MKKTKRVKLRYIMWLYFIMFTIFIVAIVWIFQILLFDGIYRNQKIESITETGNSLKSQLNTEETITDEMMSNWILTAIDASESGVLSYLAYYNADSQLVVESIFSGFVNSPATKNTLNNTNNSDAILLNVIEAPQQPNGQRPEKAAINKDIILQAINDLSQSSNEYLCYRSTSSINSDSAFYVYVSAVKNQELDGYIVLLASQQSLSETIKVIQIQLIIVSVVVVLLSFFVAMYISKRLSKPITEMSETAKQWAGGDNKVEFKGDGYEELKELSDMLNYAKDGINQTGVLQRDLLANVSHDLKTPLTMIKAYAEMIRDLSGEVKAKREAHTNVIIDETDRLAMLVNDILDLSKLQNGMNTLNLTTINLSSLCETVISRFKDFVEQNGFKIQTEIEQNLFTLADEQKIEQVIYNLVGNSINYTGEDKTILVRLTKNNDTILFETIDSGKGISEDKINTIWDKYYRFADTHQRPVKGTGLGLSIVKTILENHKLKFGVISKKDIGSNFFVEFKVHSNE